MCTVWRKIARHKYWVHIGTGMKEIGFRSYQGDPYVYIHESKKDDVSESCEHFLLHTDDCLVISLRVGGSKYFVIKYI